MKKLEDLRMSAPLVDVFRNDMSVILHGDCLTALREHVSDGSVDLVFADPPYNIGKSFGRFRDRWPSDKAYAEWCYEWLAVCLRKLKDNGSLYVMTSTRISY